MSEIPYTTKIPWWYRLILTSSPTILFLLVPVSEWILAWQSWTWFFKLIVNCFICVFFIAGLDSFLRRTNFSHETIEHRNFLGIIKVKKYRDIINIKATEQNIKIIFSDKSSIEIWTAEGNIHRVLRIIKKKRKEK